MEIRLLANANEAAGRVALFEGHADEAARHARLGLVLAAGMAQEQQLLMQLIRVAIDQAHLAFIRTILVEGRPSAPALAALAPQFETAQTRSPAVLGLAGEMKFVNGLLSEMAAGEHVWAESESAGVYLLSHAFSWTVRPAIFASHARALDQLHRTVEFARLQPFERRTKKLVLPADEPQPWWWRRLAKFTWAGFGRVVGSSDEHLALARIASAAVALRRHKLDHGSYPPSLEALVPAFLARVPLDPFTGRPLKYLAEGEGFSLSAEVMPGTLRPERFQWKIPQ
jgi:hypothetical protein